MSKTETPSTEPKKPSKEITYHVGWKKGKIQYQDSNKTASQAKAAPGTSGQTHIHPGRSPMQLLQRWVWREAVYPGEASVRIALYALPAVTFGAVLWLVYVLANTN